MSPSASQPPLPAAAPRLTLARWLRIGLLLFVAQALALGLQALLLIHKEGELLTGLTASRIGIAADEVRATFTRSAANGLTLAEARGVARLLPRLVADDADITAIHVFDSHRQLRFALGPGEPPASA
ncbi:hypothetical protein, partial [Zoogloea oryzae]|uniref:hypothetical protein n=1 Tax=Zoogloea oryzae TaxID=310767 RepID=UPI0024E0E009